MALVLRHHVHDWLDRVTGPRVPPSFPLAVDALVRTSLGSIIDRCEKVDWANLIVGKIVPRLTAHLDRFRAAEAAYRGRTSQSSRSAPSDVLDEILIANRYTSDGVQALHPAVDVAGLDSRPSEEAHVRSLVDRILGLVMPRSYSLSPFDSLDIGSSIACYSAKSIPAQCVAWQEKSLLA